MASSLGLALHPSLTLVWYTSSSHSLTTHGQASLVSIAGCRGSLHLFGDRGIGDLHVVELFLADSLESVGVYAGFRSAKALSDLLVTRGVYDGQAASGWHDHLHRGKRAHWEDRKITMLLTDSRSESEESEASKGVFVQVWAAGAQKGSASPVILAVVGGVEAGR